ncbi:flavin-dependent dehydrogenase [Paraburkholderia atlantica]|uniref:FAD-dependent oxidoreductase n=1 Tax=Paraburkholderia atlantica TaxID=2654982 RepID=UPI003D1EE269
MKTGTRIVRRGDQPTGWKLDADVCIVGAGIAGTSAALEAAALGRKVVLVDSLPALGAVVSHAPSLTEFDIDPLDVIETGDWVRVDAERGVVEVLKRSRP